MGYALRASPMGVYVIAGLVTMSRTLLIRATVIAFGAWPGAFYAFLGSRINGTLIYAIGRFAGRDVINEWQARCADSKIEALNRHRTTRVDLAGGDPPDADSLFARQLDHRRIKDPLLRLRCRHCAWPRAGDRPARGARRRLRRAGAAFELALPACVDRGCDRGSRGDMSHQTGGRTTQPGRQVELAVKQRLKNTIRLHKIALLGFS